MEERKRIRVDKLPRMPGIQKSDIDEHWWVRLLEDHDSAAKMREGNRQPLPYAINFHSSKNQI